jgi:Ulp1 family protease
MLNAMPKGSRIQYHSVQQQNDGSSCGVFTIAFAMELMTQNDPSNATFDISRIRMHLFNCLNSDRFTRFPHC